MKLQFEPNQQYQLDAVKALVDVFAGQPVGSGLGGEQELERIPGQQATLEQASAHGNVCLINDTQIINNVHTVQEKNGLSLSEIEGDVLGDGAGNSIGDENGRLMLTGIDTRLKDGRNFTVEMETGTGKTYVYLRTIHELHENYGWKKFIIVVPSVAIREGVLKNLEITREHFAEIYSKPEMNYYVWDSKKTGQAREFATNDTLQIMVITIDSFAKAQNIINKESDFGRPLDFIKATSPIVIMDEPQNMETDIRRAAIESLNPLCTLRFSATHKHAYNMLYRLTPVDAYDKGLVKKIEVHSVLSEDSYSDAYISILSIERSGKSRLLVKLELDISDERGLQRKVVKAAPGDDLSRITRRSVYEGYVIESIDHAEQAVEFSNGKVVYVGQKDESLREEIMKRQIELTVEDHFEKQKKLSAENVKVLSLFFIDKVANYRAYTESGYAKGKFAAWFEEAYEKVAAKPKFAGVMEGLTASDVHNGYFAADKNGKWKDSKDTKGEGAKTKDDDGAYGLIMRDKERLLDMAEPLRFIFSHSALREGWDNPNVFNICTLNESSSEMKKRQEIGRGLRLPVNADGERVRDENINVLTVVANESYADFSRKLQTEIEDETGVSFGGGRIKDRDNRIRVGFRKGIELDPNFKELWECIKHKTTYRVNIDPVRLVDVAVRQLKEVTISRPQLSDTRTKIEGMSGGLKSREVAISSRVVSHDMQRVPDILASVQARTYLTRRIIFDILDQSNMFEHVPTNPQQVIDEVIHAINRTKHELAVDGIKYEKTGELYDMKLFENKELKSYLYDAAAKRGAVKVAVDNKTAYDYVEVDSEVERNFMESLEQNESVMFYVKLPGWFKIETPLGNYNPDWAVVFDDDERIYFVAETKSSDDINDNHISENERGKIKAARQHFKALGVSYAAPVQTLAEAIGRVGELE